MVVEVKPGWKAGTKVSYDIEVRDERYVPYLSRRGWKAGTKVSYDIEVRDEKIRKALS